MATPHAQTQRHCGHCHSTNTSLLKHTGACTHEEGARVAHRIIHKLVKKQNTSIIEKVTMCDLSQKSFPTAPQPWADSSRHLANKKCKNFTRKNCNIKTTDPLSALRWLCLNKGLAITKFKSTPSSSVKSKVQKLSHQSMYGKVEFPDTQSFQKAKHVLLKLVEKPSDQITEMEQL